MQTQIVDAETERAVPLPLAAQELRLSYWQARDAVLRGELRGFKSSGRWFVMRQSLARAKTLAERDATRGPTDD